MESASGVEEATPVFYVGQHESTRSSPVTEHLLRQAQDCNYDMLTTPITTSHFHTRVLTLLASHISELANDTDNSIATTASLSQELPGPLLSAFSPLDTNLTPNESISQLLAVASSWIDLASRDPLIADLSRQVLNLEIAYAAFCGIGNVIVDGPSYHYGKITTARLSQYARAIQEALTLGPYLQLQIMLPTVEEPEAGNSNTTGDLAPFVRGQYLERSQQEKESKIDVYGAWDIWNVIRSTCKYNSRLSVALILPRHLPPMRVQDRWYSEPLRLLMLPATSFLHNAKGYPVLSKPHQLMISRYMRLRHPPWILLSDVGPIPGLGHPNMPVEAANGLMASSNTEDALQTTKSPSPTPAEASQLPAKATRKSKDPTPHLSYIRYLQRNQPAKSTIERFGAGYQDYLQAPLQPLTDNLESITYEVFEKDPVKYDWYERAIAMALKDWRAHQKPTSGPDGKVVIAVVGAGRGPLVTRALRAADETGVPADIWAVEKNPNAYVVLQRHNWETWNQRVTVVKSDMRFWLGPSIPVTTRSASSTEDISSEYGYVDILVSELLGSFGDNELSPECLDGVQHVLNPTYGISIPSSYSAHLTPISSPKLHADILGRTTTDPEAWQTPYVVMLHALDYLSTSNTTTPTNATALTSHPTTSAKPPANDQQPTIPTINKAWEFKHPISPAILQQSRLRRGGGAAGGGAGGVTGGDGANAHNARFAQLRFECAERGVYHGLAGYFECVLYDGQQMQDEEVDWEGKIVELSTNPLTMERKSRDMISWFPIYFPLKTPMYIPPNSTLQISIWRQTDDRKVWYEWMVEAFCRVEPGREVRIGCSDLHSSRKNGCLM